VSQSTISRAERGWLDDLTLRIIRAIFTALEARVQLMPRWRGAELARLLDEDHAVIVAEVAQSLERFGWEVEVEVTYAEFGERGSIDILAVKPGARAAVVVEVKTDIASSEAVGRKIDEKARLVPKIVSVRYGWAPASIGRLLVMPESMRLRRLVDRHPVIGRMFPAKAVSVRRWLRAPAGAIAALWFLSNTTPRTAREGRTPAARRIRPGSSVPRAGSRGSAAQIGVGSALALRVESGHD
jgi:hypothetical protein